LEESNPDKIHEIGLEQTPQEYVGKLVELFREIRRVLRPDGTVWLNLADSYKEKQLLGIPWRVAFALQVDGWHLRQDVIWCLSGGTFVYVRTQKGDGPMSIKDMARLNPSTVKLWNGVKWTQLLGISKTSRTGDEIEIVLRSGEKISCTPSHKFPTERGVVCAQDIQKGDVLKTCKLPEPEKIKDCAIDEDAAWLAGLYLAEGSKSNHALCIAGHKKEEERWVKVLQIVQKYGGSAKRTLSGNKMDIRIYGKILHAIVDLLVSGKTAYDKGFSPVVWKYSNKFIAAMLNGYLSGDAHKTNCRWRLGFCRNYNLELSLRTACARLGYSLTLNACHVKYQNGIKPAFRGELRKIISNHFNNKNRAEVVEIRKARARHFYDIGVEDTPHLFSLSSGVLSHNSKKHCMPESVKDRCVKSHEYVFLLTKSPKYFFDHIAIREETTTTTKDRLSQNVSAQNGSDRVPGKTNGNIKAAGDFAYRNKRSVWRVAPQPYKGSHFATFSYALVEPMILAGCPETCCKECGSPYIRKEKIVGKQITQQMLDSGADKDGNYTGQAQKDYAAGKAQNASDTKRRILESMSKIREYEFVKNCSCETTETKPGVVLDPFLGSGTTAWVAKCLNRDYIGIELNKEYLPLIEERIQQPKPEKKKKKVKKEPNAPKQLSLLEFLE
jgi:DNA modification methylase